MADNPTSGNNDKKVGSVSSFTKILGSPLRSPSMKPKTPKRSSSSSSPWARFNIAKIFGSKNSSKAGSQSERGIEADINTEEDASFQKGTSEVVQSPAEKIEEESPATIKTKEEAIITADPKNSPSETDEKKDATPSKVEPMFEKPKDEVKAKGNETLEKTEASLEQNVAIGREVVFEPKDKPLGDQRPHNEPIDATSSDKNPVGGPEGINPTDQSCPPRDQEEDKNKADNCISSLAQGLQTLCAPPTAK